MTDDAIVEAVARAICESTPLFNNGWKHQEPVEKAVWRNVARAAIAAYEQATIAKVAADLIANSKPLAPEFAECVDEHFWDLVDNKPSPQQEGQ